MPGFVICMNRLGWALGLCERPIEMEPAVNVEEKIGKTVGRRRKVDSVQYAAGLQRLANNVARSQRRGICPRGVFRFHTHEEADQWLTKMMARQVRAT